ncbi:MAG: hypothetical protein RDV48_28655 [Candidatus Eremiobacteraeota bacterium]|nr:hypothetical protein [Candidatus Eremiobacteraeota bacterium]
MNSHPFENPWLRILGIIAINVILILASFLMAALGVRAAIDGNRTVMLLAIFGIVAIIVLLMILMRGIAGRHPITGGPVAIPPPPGYVPEDPERDRL